MKGGRRFHRRTDIICPCGKHSPQYCEGKNVIMFCHGLGHFVTGHGSMIETFTVDSYYLRTPFRGQHSKIWILVLFIDHGPSRLTNHPERTRRWTTQPSTMGGPLCDPGVCIFHSTAVSLTSQHQLAKIASEVWVTRLPTLSHPPHSIKSPASHRKMRMSR